jgi:hypothetical protein
MGQTPEVNHAQAQEFFMDSMDRLARAVGAVFSRRSGTGQEWVGPITEAQWKALYTITEKMLEFMLSIRP